MDVLRRFFRRSGQTTNLNQGVKEENENPPRYSGIIARTLGDDEKLAYDKDGSRPILDEEGERVTVLVGPKAMKYCVLESKLCKHSGFFEAQRRK
ncbi:hypothetical protein Slin14017_G054480 [Septoria linicola]|nr:hypothetical protein Slin14017_G054480 [Septoria linicola]